MCELNSETFLKMPRRDFLKTVGATSVGVSLSSNGLIGESAFATYNEEKKGNAPDRNLFHPPDGRGIHRLRTGARGTGRDP